MPITLDDLHLDDEDKAQDNLDDNKDNIDDTDDPRKKVTLNTDDDDDKGIDDKDIKGKEDDVVVPGIEQYLSEYGIEAGMISMEDDEGKFTDKHFNELSNEEQFNVLKSLAEQGSKKAIRDHGLNEDETGLINYVRANGGDIEAILEGMAMKRLEQERALSEATGVDYENMSKDALYTKWIKEANPEATDEEIAAELSTAKESKFFDTNVGRIKDGFITEQKEEARKRDIDYKKEVERELEEDRSIIVNAVTNIDNIIGFPIDDAVKNEVLSKLLEVGESGDSLFMEEIFSDPKTLFKVALLHYKGEEYVNSLDTYYKKEITKAHNRGKSLVIDGLPTKPIHGRKTLETIGDATKPPRGAERINLSDLHNED
jgi:hypothetical protein